jgi:HAE1 family hydrophobic/amphiphilic exporter-1
MEHGWNGIFDRILSGYRKVLVFNEKNRFIAIAVLFIVVLVFVHSLSLAKKVGFGFFTDPDKGQIAIKLEYPTRYNLKQTQLRVQQVEDRVKDLPELKRMLTTIGKVEGVIGQSSEGVYLAQILRGYRAVIGRSLPGPDSVEIL